jgi:hypothetical protein
MPPQPVAVAPQAARIADTTHLVEEVARLAPPAPRAAVAPVTTPTVRPAASLRPEPTAEEQQKRAAELWRALVARRSEQEAAAATPAPQPMRVVTPRPASPPARPVAVAPVTRNVGLEDKLAELQARLSGLRETTNGNGHTITESPVKESHGAA